MAFCKNCGKELLDGEKFCASCGTPVGEAQQENTQAQQPANAQPLSEEADAQQNKAMGVLSYFGLLVLVPIFAAKESKFARFHATQGTTLAIFEIAYSILNLIITAILGAIFPLEYHLFYGYTHGAVYNIITTILGLCSIFFLVLAIIGIVNAAQGKKNELPLIGKIDILGKFMK